MAASARSAFPACSPNSAISRPAARPCPSGRRRPRGDDFVAARGARRRASSASAGWRTATRSCIDGARQSFVIEHAREDMVYFQAMVRPGAAPLAAEYDRETLRFLSASSTDEASSRIQMMVSLLRAMDREDALPLMETAAGKPAFLHPLACDARDAGAGCGGGAAGAQADGERAIPIPRCAPPRHRRWRRSSRTRRRRHAPPDRRRDGGKLDAGRAGRSSRNDRARHARRGQFRQLRRGAEEARQQPRLPRRSDDRGAQGALRRPGPRQPVQRPGRDAARQRVRLSDPRQFLAGDAGQRHPPERHRSLPLPCAARPQFLVPDRRLSRVRLLERLLRI